MIDLRPDQLALVHAILSRHLPEQDVWAFGSRVRGNAKRYSDLDLVLIGPMPEDAILRRLRDDFDDSRLPFSVDVVCLEELPEVLRRQIESEHHVVRQNIAAA